MKLRREYDGHLIDSLAQLVESQLADLEEFECGECGAITKAATWQEAMDAHDCPAYDKRDSAHFHQQQMIAEGLR